MSDSDSSSSSEVEEKISIDSINPSLSDLFPLKTSDSLYFPPLSSLNLTSKIKAQVFRLLKSEPVLSLRKILFWQVFGQKLKNFQSENIRKKFDSLLSQSYASLMLLKIKEKFDEALDFLPIAIGHSIHHELWNLFKQSRHYFDLRFEIDCYKIVYNNLLGLQVSDIFVKSTAKRLLGDYFLAYKKKTKSSHTEKKRIATQAIEEKMQDHIGGKEFVRELLRATPVQRKANFPQKINNNENVLLEPFDQLINERIEKHMSDTSLRKSFLDKTGEKTFNCVKLSPMICGYIGSSTKQVPFKSKHLTPHKNQAFEEKTPTFVKVLKQHCDEKRSKSAAKLRRNEIKLKLRKSRLGGIFDKSSENIRDDDPLTSKRYDDVFKLQGKLNDAFPIDQLYTNRSKYGL